MKLFDVAVRMMLEDVIALMRSLSRFEPGYEAQADAPFNLKSLRITAGAAPPEIQAICSILRKHVTDPMGPKLKGRTRRRSSDDNAPRVVENIGIYGELEILTRCLNEPIAHCHLYASEKGQPWQIFSVGSPVRVVADHLIRYLENFDDRRLLKHDPISICPQCNALYIKTKTSQIFCSTNCRVSSWGRKKGKEYFRNKQEKYRASLKEQEDRIRRKQKGDL